MFKFACTVFLMQKFLKYAFFCTYRTAELQDKIHAVQDDIQRINTCIEEHESERSTKYRELRRKEQIFKGTHVCLMELFKGSLFLCTLNLPAVINVAYKFSGTV